MHGLTRRSLLSLSAIAVLPHPVMAQAWPTHPLRFVVPAAPGAGSAGLARGRRSTTALYVSEDDDAAADDCAPMRTVMNSASATPTTGTPYLMVVCGA